MAAKSGRVFSSLSESVNEGHPDKVCDQVSDPNPFKFGAPVTFDAGKASRDGGSGVFRESFLMENALSAAPRTTFGAAPCPYSDVRLKEGNRAKSPNKISCGRRNLVPEFRSPWASTYTVQTTYDPPFQLHLDALLPPAATLAATQRPGDAVGPLAARNRPHAAQGQGGMGVGLRR